MFSITHCPLTPRVQGTTANTNHIRINLILPESRVIDYIFEADSIGLSSFKIFVVGSERRLCLEPECVMALQGHPRSLILAPIESTCETSYWLSIVILVLSFPVSEILRVFCWKQHPHAQYPTRTEFWGVPLGLDCRYVGSQRSEDRKVITFELTQHILNIYPYGTTTSETDRRTDDLR